MSEPIPPMPPGWNKTIADLFVEMERSERSFIGRPEGDWAREYERSLIPAGTRFPQRGDVYEAMEDMAVDYLTSWTAPFTGGGEGTLKKGERVMIDNEPSDSLAISAYAVAVDYKTLEERIVPAADRNAPKYGGFYFFFKTLDLNRKFRLVPQEG